MPSLADDPAFASLAEALNGPLSAVLLTREMFMDYEASGLATEGKSNPLVEYQRPEEWESIGEWDALGTGFKYVDGDRVWDIALFDADRRYVEDDVGKIFDRMEGYTSVTAGLGWSTP